MTIVIQVLVGERFQIVATSSISDETVMRCFGGNGYGIVEKIHVFMMASEKCELKWGTH